ncbi:MAG: tetratricopeptide repeat protein [Aureisphaera sp.]
MNIQTFTYLLANPQTIHPEQVKELDTLLEKYPYFQSARALQLKGLKNQNSYLYNDALKIAAAHTTDRDILFEYITSKEFIQNDISEAILQQSDAIKDIEVISENVSETVSREIHEQLQTEMKKAEAILNPELFERKSVPVAITPSEEKEKATSEEVLEINEPITFTKSDTHSFGEWLKLTQAQPIEREELEVDEDQTNLHEDRQRKFELIEKFIQERPKIEPKQTPKKNKNLAKPYTQAPEQLMTETLAKVYLQQKNYKKAIQAYKILILKNPEKSGFFADQIRAIEKLIKTEEQ